MREISTITTIAGALVSTIKCGEMLRLDIQKNLDSDDYIGYLTIGDIRDDYKECHIYYAIHTDGTVEKIDK